MLKGSPYNLFVIIVALIALLVAIVAAVYGRAALFPGKRVLVIALSKPASLIPDGPLSHHEISLEIDGVIIEQPLLTNVEYRITGRYDINSSAFDQQKPLAIDFAIPVAIAAVQPQHSSIIGSDGNQVLLKPTLLRKGARISFSVITDGKPPEVTQSNALIDTSVKMIDISDELITWRRNARLSLLSTTLGVAVATFSTYQLWSLTNRFMAASDAFYYLTEDLMKACGIK